MGLVVTHFSKLREAVPHLARNAVFGKTSLFDVKGTVRRGSMYRWRCDNTFCLTAMHMEYCGRLKERSERKPREFFWAPMMSSTTWSEVGPKQPTPLACAHWATATSSMRPIWHDAWKGAVGGQDTSPRAAAHNIHIAHPRTSGN